MDERLAKLSAAVAAVNAESPTDLLLYNGPIDNEGFEQVVENTNARQADTVTLLLTTLGGDAGAAYRIASLLCHRYKKFRLMVSGMCKSAGTLIAVGSSEIVMTDTGELGPLDVQIRKRDELLQRESGLEMVQGLQNLTHSAIDAFRDTFLEIASGSGLSSRLCADIAANVVGHLYGNIFSQIDPIRLGSLVRANSIAMQYGEKLGTKNLKPDALRRLVLGYPSHDFVIDRPQANDLFQNVRPPTQAESELVSLVQVLLRHPNDEDHEIARLDDPPGEYAHGTPKQPVPPAGSYSEAPAGRENTTSANEQDVKANQRVARGSIPATQQT
jgi:hypothetical protein